MGYKRFGDAARNVEGITTDTFHKEMTLCVERAMELSLGHTKFEMLGWEVSRPITNNLHEAFTEVALCHSYVNEIYDRQEMQTTVDIIMGTVITLLVCYIVWIKIKKVK